MFLDPALLKRIVAFWLLVLLAPGPVSLARAADLDAILERGEIVVGVKADYEPFGYRDASGALVGLEADIAARLAGMLGVDLRLVAVTSSNRLQKLAAGEVDLLVATLGDTLDRRRLVRMVEPGYYGGGASVLVPGESLIREWADLKGRPLCAVQGALWNRLAATRMLAEIRAFGSVRDAELALRDGACAGWLYDEAAIEHRLASGEWAGYRMLDAQFVSPWAMAVGGEGRLASFLDEAVADWLRTGWLSGLETKWGLSPSTYVRQAEERWSRRDADGGWHCRLDGDGKWPPDCRDLDLIQAQDLHGIGAAVLALRDGLGLDLTPFYDPFSRAAFVKALATTLLLAVAAVMGSLVAGIGGAAMLRSGFAAVRMPAAAVLALFRMTPPLLQLYLVFFGIGSVLAARGLTLDALWVAVAVLSLYAGAANAVALSDAAAAIPRPAGDRYRRIALLAYPAIMGSCINIVKATAMASTIAVGELVHASTAIIADHGNAGVMMNILLGCYVALVVAVVHGFGVFERKVLLR